ncbi:uncharacterized protein EAE97_003088 [Botrytis byssoidea]|uniref:Uncharacterized protein n=1 Tax=Botrytis byssoidea TaxID=139641 RepID=A0A9P5M1S8_9HELO|nr:uncharacterized protein EAE97_003088 [Botrytis byssoidea]KAF7949579.1 hypothetical protein EAE97_003088 [Botrytis byssoidea]
MKIADVTALVMLPSTALATCGTAYSSSKIDGTLLRAVVINMGTDATNITATQYDQYFEQGSALEGVKALIAAGQVYINLWSIPSTEASFKSSSDCLSDGYTLNQVAWLSSNAMAESWLGGYKAETAEDSYDAAALSVITSIVAGLEVRFWDTNGDGYTDLIDADYLEGVTVDTITENANGTFSVYRGNIDVENKTPYEGTIFEAECFAGSGIAIEAANFDTTIKSGDVCLFWYGPSGWAMERALEINGLFVDGADHTFYDIAGVTYEDAMLFSRDNLFISNRPGEFTDTQKFFGLTNDTAAGLDVSLWLVPVTNAGNSAAFLTRAVAQAQAELANVTISADGSDVPST